MSEVQLDYICLAQTPTAPISGSVLMLCPQSVQMATPSRTSCFRYRGPRGS